MSEKYPDTELQDAFAHEHDCIVASLRDRIAELEKALAPFAAIKPSSFYAADGSEAEEYTVSLKLNDGDGGTAEFTGADLSRVRAVLSQGDRTAEESPKASVEPESLQDAPGLAEAQEATMVLPRAFTPLWGAQKPLGGAIQMTEREYVEMFRKAAETYIALGDSHTAAAHEYWRWQDLKQSLSARTAIALCDAWLTMQEAAE